MRVRLLLATVGLATTGIVVAPAAAEAAPAGCVASSTGMVLACDQWYPTARDRGGIGLLGDSVLLGSNDGVSNPGLPSMLAADEWGPIRMTTSVGMRTYHPTTANASAIAQIDKWKAAGFTPRVIAINLGANHLLECTPSTVLTCKARIDQLLDKIAAAYPDAAIWWAKVVQRVFPSGSYSQGMLGWNAALDLAATARPNLVLWDWPSALATSGIVTDIGGIHPVSGAEYVKRSTLLAAHLRTFMPARYLGAGAATALPVATAGVREFVPADPATLYDSTDPAIDPLAGGVVRVVDLSADPDVPDDAAAVAVTLTVVNPAASGHVRAYGCDGAVPYVSNVNFLVGRPRTAQAIVQLGSPQQLCLLSSAVTDVVVSLQGAFVPMGTPGADTLTPAAPSRAFDAAIDSGVPTTVTLLPSPGAANDGVAINLTIDQAGAAGKVTVRRCDGTDAGIAQLSFAAGETVAASLYARAGAANTVCVTLITTSPTRSRVIVDVNGYFRTEPSGLRYQPVTPTRLLDTRVGAGRKGAWYGMHARNQVLSLPVTPLGGAAPAAVTGTLTVTGTAGPGHLTSFGCGSAVPRASSINYIGGQTVANAVTAAVDPTKGTLCIRAAESTNTIFDLTGWWVGAAG